MGSSQSVPIKPVGPTPAPAPVPAPLPSPVPAPVPAAPSPEPITGSKLKDVTLRSVIFGRRDVDVIKYLDGSMVLKDKVDSVTFDSYVHVLKIMAQLSRLVYCDLSMIREVMLDPVFGGTNNKAVNDAITKADARYLSMRRTPASGGQNGRPMQSYVYPPAKDTSSRLLKYCSSPSDLTFIVMTGEQLKSKNSFFTDSDMIICFKGSSTIKNFKHDLYSQFTPAELSSMMPPGTSVLFGEVGNVAGSFVTPISKSWELLKTTILEKKPTRLIVTGHSLGGAYATMFSLIVAECRMQVFPYVRSLHLVTFGCPTLLSDKARNTFNSHLESGFMTLDRVTSSGIRSRLADIIPGVPVGFSHPGYQPLRTEIYPEKKTGRAYNIDTIRKVYQTGGLLGIGVEKNKYEAATKVHMPTRIVIPAVTLEGNAFAHGEYFDMTWLGAFRMYGMKNPGFVGNTFVGEVYQSGISWKYISADSTDIPAGEPGPEDTGKMPTDAPPSAGTRRKTYRKKSKNIRKTMKQ